MHWISMKNHTTKYRKMKQLLFCILLFNHYFIALEGQNNIRNFLDISKSKYTFENFIPLPKGIPETSGLYFDGRTVWTINDGGNPAEIFGLFNNYDSTVSLNVDNIIKTQFPLPLENIDWEAITGDGDFIYIGDFGNNPGNRKNLCIYKISKSQIQNKRVEHVDTIQFNYPEQSNFESRFFHNFDCESMFVKGDSIYLLTKNWQNRHSEIYRLPKKKGIYPAQLVGTFKPNFLITDACLVENKIYVSGYNFTGKQFIGSLNFGSWDGFQKQKIKMKPGQIEGICFIPNKGFILSTEQRKTRCAGIFMLKSVE
jgi:hypothetical protein